MERLEVVVDQKGVEGWVTETLGIAGAGSYQNHGICT